MHYLCVAVISKIESCCANASLARQASQPTVNEEDQKFSLLWQEHKQNSDIPMRNNINFLNTSY